MSIIVQVANLLSLAPGTAPTSQSLTTKYTANALSNMYVTLSNMSGTSSIFGSAIQQTITANNGLTVSAGGITVGTQALATVIGANAGINLANNLTGTINFGNNASTVSEFTSGTT